MTKLCEIADRLMDVSLQMQFILSVYCSKNDVKIQLVAKQKKNGSTDERSYSSDKSTKKKKQHFNAFLPEAENSLEINQKYAITFVGIARNSLRKRQNASLSENINPREGVKPAVFVDGA